MSYRQEVDITGLLQQYKPGGTSNHHPRMLLKVLVYGDINNIYSSLKIEEALDTNIYFMWLSSMKKPDHNTINRFRVKAAENAATCIHTGSIVAL